MARSDFTPRLPGLNPNSAAGRLLGAAQRGVIDNPTVFTAGILLLLWLVLSQLSPYFFTVSNLFEITVQAAVIALIAVGQTFVILAKGIDLSVGAILAAAAVTSTMVMDAGYGLPAGVIAGLLCGAFFGAANGIAVGVLRIPPFVATLGMMGIARGYALIITEGIPIFRVAEGFEVLGQGRVWGVVPVPTIATLGLYAIGLFVLLRTRLGRYTFAIGSNQQATKVSGINVPLYLILIYGLSGITAAIAGLTEASRIGSGQPAGGGRLRARFDRRRGHRRHQPVRRPGQPDRLADRRAHHRHAAQRSQRARRLRLLAAGGYRCYPDRRRLHRQLAASEERWRRIETTSPRAGQRRLCRQGEKKA